MGIIENISTCSLYQYVVLFNAIFLSGGGVSKREKKISFFKRTTVSVKYISLCKEKIIILMMVFLSYLSKVLFFYGKSKV